MFFIRLWIIVLGTTLFLGEAPLRAEDDDPTLRGKKLTEWIEQLQSGKTLEARKAGLLALQIIGPRKSRKVTQAIIAALRENTEDSIRSGSARALGSIASGARDE